MTFEDFGFDERILKAVKEAGFSSPMPVQEQCFSLLIKEKRDVYAQSQTGTGKTAAFLLSIFQLKISEEKYKDEKALIVVPTRELAIQIEKEARDLGKYLDYSTGAVFGGVGYGKQNKMLENGVDVLIGTPGRLLDFSKQKKLNFKDFGFLVIDEADRLFDMGFLPDLRRIFKSMRPYNQRLTMLFSATMNSRVGNLAWEYMNNPGEVIIEPEKKTVDSVTQELYHVGKDEKLKLLLGLLRRDNPSNAIIFTNTRHSAWEVAKRLEVNGYHVVPLMGDLPQSKRTRIVEDVKSGKIKFLVATDVAARGLHVDELEMVINYDVPQEPESYIHRIGRTARAGRKGKTITLACEEFVYGLSPIEKLIGSKIPVSWADEDLFAEDKSEGMKFAVNDRFREMKSNKRKKMDPRMSKVQSVVSMAAGGNIEEFSRNEKPSAASGKKQSNKKSRRRTSHGKPDRNASEGKGMSKPSARESITEERISAESTPEERLAYYRKKYGEDFKFSGSEGSGRPGASSGGDKKQRRASGEIKRRRSGASSGGDKKLGTSKSGNKKSKVNNNLKKASGSRQEKTDKKSGKGLFSRLFSGKK